MLYSVVSAGVAHYIATSYNFKLKLHLDVTSCFHLFQHCQYFQGKNFGAGKGAGVGEKARPGVGARKGQGQGRLLGRAPIWLCPGGKGALVAPGMTLRGNEGGKKIKDNNLQCT